MIIYSRVKKTITKRDLPLLLQILQLIAIPILVLRLCYKAKTLNFHVCKS